MKSAPPGCAFQPRCAHAAPQCRTARPELREISGSRVACVRTEEL
ncbi:hypothetical protein OG842_03700 [Streptomyces sp. NBC_00376]